MLLCLVGFFFPMWIWSKGLPVLHLVSTASSSSSAETSSLNVSEKNAASTEGGPPPRFFIGVALTFGFILMFVVDQIGKYCSMHGKFVRTLGISLILQNVSLVNILYVFLFITTTCAMSHFRPNDSFAEQCWHHSHIGTGYSCCRYSIIQHDIYCAFYLTCVCQRQTTHFKELQVTSMENKALELKPHVTHHVF